MNQYIARQPILNVHKKLFAYELLYRGDKDYTLDQVSGEIMELLREVHS